MGMVICGVGVLGLTAPVAGTQAEACTTGGWRNLRLSRIFFWQSLLGPPSLIIALIIEYLTSAMSRAHYTNPESPFPQKESGMCRYSHQISFTSAAWHSLM